MARYPISEWFSWQTFAWYALVLVVYYALMLRVLLQMLQAKPNTVLLVFAFIALFPAPPAVVVGIVIMILWAFHRRTL
ncbi:MAG: hypothetical protein V3S29_01865 [bacterium]